MSRFCFLLKAIKLYIVGILIGALLGFMALPVSPATSTALVEALYTLPEKFAIESDFWEVFIKNSIASLAIIYLGLLLSILEFSIYKATSENTYNLLDSMTSLLYKALRRFFPVFSELKPFYRSCFFYLNFIPVFGMLVNGSVFGFLLAYHSRVDLRGEYLVSLLPHAILEIPALVLSATLAFLVAGMLEGALLEADLNRFRKGVGEIAKSRVVLSCALFLQFLFFISAYLETC